MLLMPLSIARCLFVLLLSYFAWSGSAQAVFSCSEVFVAKNLSSEPSGLISLYRVSEAFKAEQEAAGTRKTTESPLSYNRLEALKKKGRRGKKIRFMDHDLSRRFKEIMVVSSSNLSHLSGRVTIELFSVFAHWNLLPPKSIQQSLNEALLRTLPSWDVQNFKNFANARLLTPFELSPQFMENYIRIVVETFSSLPPHVRTDVLGAELLHGTHFRTHELKYLLSKTTQGLLEGTDVFYTQKTLKELYRGMLYLRAREAGSYFTQLVALEKAIEVQLQLQDTSLQRGGFFAHSRHKQKEDPLLTLLFDQLRETFPGHFFFKEFSRDGLIGFFDPVDIYYPRLGLVVEFDGNHHYFRSLTLEGQFANNTAYVLRPMDQAKDMSLQAMGVAVLRVRRDRKSVV